MKDGVELIADERKRQIEVEGYDESHDEKWINDELATVAACYALPRLTRRTLSVIYEGKVINIIDNICPWSREFFKPTTEIAENTRKNRIRELTKAGALIAAEIDRLQR